MSKKSYISYKDWHISLLDDQITLSKAVASLNCVKADQQQIPLMVQLVENPKFSIPGFQVFHGAVDLKQHDYIHIVLGRGLLPMDEAFTIGFTMGTTNKVTTTEEALYGFVSKYLYPKVYQFGDQEHEVFKNAVRLGYISQCLALDEFDFSPHLHVKLSDLRRKLGLELELLVAYFNIEKARYPNSKASNRLLSTQIE